MLTLQSKLHMNENSFCLDSSKKKKNQQQKNLSSAFISSSQNNFEVKIPQFLYTRKVRHQELASRKPVPQVMMVCPVATWSVILYGDWHKLHDRVIWRLNLSLAMWVEDYNVDIFTALVQINIFCTTLTWLSHLEPFQLVDIFKWPQIQIKNLGWDFNLFFFLISVGFGYQVLQTF